MALRSARQFMVSAARGCLRDASAALVLASMIVPLIVATASAQAQSRHYKILYSFGGTAWDGITPEGSLVQDAVGNLYGTTEEGGASGYYGTVFAVNRSGQEEVLHSFNYGDGAYPDAGLIQDAAGNLYGTTYSGGAYGHGTVFELTP
jgi:uncharacterized repeat protein (TIGR03803 family)